MALATQCPHCYTSFRVANDQLKLYAGMVRCGTCKQTFNGIEHLIPPGSTPKQAPSPDQVKQNTQVEQLAQAITPTTPEPPRTSGANEVDELGLDQHLRALVQEIKARQLEDEIAANESGIVTPEKTGDEASTPDAHAHVASQVAGALEIKVSETTTDTGHKATTANEIDFAAHDALLPAQNAEVPKKLQLEASEIESLRSLEIAIESELNLYDDATDNISTAQEESSTNSEANETSAGITNTLPIDDLSPEIDEINNIDELPQAEVTIGEKEETPDFVRQAQRKQRYGKWTSVALSLGALIGLSGALAQSSYFFRDTIAAEYPQTKPHLLKLCQIAKCEIKLPAQKSQLEISGSELQILTNEPLVNELNFQIQNKGKSAQTWPHVELILKDVRGKTVLQKVISPSVYLDNKAQLITGIAGDSESAHKLNFELSIPKASSYTLGLFYP